MSSETVTKIEWNHIRNAMQAYDADIVPTPLGPLVVPQRLYDLAAAAGLDLSQFVIEQQVKAFSDDVEMYGTGAVFIDESGPTHVPLHELNTLAPCGQRDGSEPAHAPPSNGNLSNRRP